MIKLCTGRWVGKKDYYQALLIYQLLEKELKECQNQEM